MIQGLVDYVDTDFAITVQNDGYGLNKGQWRNQFLDWDYIGAPWPAWMNIGRVGNGGFSMRSRRWIALAATPRMAPPFEHPQVHRSEDCYSCTIFRSWYEQQGMKIAPLKVAAQFSLEHPIAEWPGRNTRHTFGFHGTFAGSTQGLPIL